MTDLLEEFDLTEQAFDDDIFDQLKAKMQRKLDYEK